MRCGLRLDSSVDRRRLKQVFRNIFENSFDAGPDPVHVEITCRDVNWNGVAGLRIAVRDNGPGLNQDQRQRIFEPFYTTKSKGTGLGMAIARRIVEAHGGEITAVETSSPGALIILTLPWRQS